VLDVIPTIAELRTALRTIEGSTREQPMLAFGVEALDEKLAGGGLRLNALHEVASEGSNWGDDAAAILFVAGIAARTRGHVLWVVRSRDLLCPGSIKPA
jgi:protein ImuA